MKAKTSRRSAIGNFIDKFKELRDAALKEQMEILKEVRDNLKLFGITVTWESGPELQKPQRTTGNRADKADKICKVCGERGHDARRHRFEKRRARKAAKKSVK